MADTPTFTILETPDFARWVRKNRLTAAVNKLKVDLHVNPDLGDVIPGANGLRKVRMGGQGRGKRGGFRIIYVLLLGRSTVALLDGYSKSETEDLSADALKALIEVRNAVEAAILASRKMQDEGAK